MHDVIGFNNNNLIDPTRERLLQKKQLSILNIFKCTSVRKTRHQHSTQGLGIGGSKPTNH